MNIISHLPDVNSEIRTHILLAERNFQKSKERLLKDSGAVYPFNEIIKESYEMVVSKRDKRKNFSQYYGILKTGMTVDEIETKLKELREEWDQDI